MSKYLFLICATLLSISCSQKQIMTEQERNMILSGDENTPFRVLTVDDAADSLILRTECIDLDFKADSALIATLIARMDTTMKAENGVGLAAPQIGILRNIFLFVRIDKPGNPVEVAINPRIVNKPDETICFEGDGCLSIPGQSGNSVRYAWIEVEYLNAKGEMVRERLEGFSRKTDFTGIVFQHEFDHLRGVLYTDKLYEK
ncbi:MAG: peptide deformylase [Paludibacter sp.]|nr:peptide deformylase [Paludibacter sp.]